MSNSKRTYCNSVDSNTTAPPHRRAFLKGVGATGAVVGCRGLELMAAPQKEDGTRPVDTKEALARLIEGNGRFAKGKTRWVPMTPARLIELEKGQHPFATVLGCSDPGVPVDMIFDQGPGDLFTIRLPGNIVDPHGQRSLEYAFAYWDTMLIVVLGHEGVGW